MPAPQEQHRTGLQYLDAVTALLRRARHADPTKGLFEAADLQWWWRTERSTDSFPQLFWFDDAGRPEAAVIATDWGGTVALDTIVMPDAGAEWVAHVTERGLEHARASGLTDIELEVARDDDVVHQVLFANGFAITGDGVVETWLAAEAWPDVSTLHDGYRLLGRNETTQHPHHMVGRSGSDVEARLRQTSLYRPDLDLVVLDGADRPVAYGLFWYDAETRTGLVEPMRTEDDHQRRGLARHVLTAGLDRLAAAGAERIKICFHPDNPASGHLYLSVGFQVDRQTDVMSGHLGGQVPKP